jgi:hypothetical protein
MKWTVDTSSLPGFVTVKTEGAPSLVDSRSLWNELLTSDYWCSGTCILFDNRKMDAYPTDGSGSMLISEVLNLFQDLSGRIGDCRLAVLLGRRENFIYHRQFQVGLSIRALSPKMQIFYNEKEAIEWLTMYPKAVAA